MLSGGHALLNAMRGTRGFGATAGVLLAVAVAGGSPASAQPRNFPFGMGAVPPPPEVYDAAPSQPMLRAAVPVRVDLSPFAPKPDTQGQQGSCTAWATTFAARTILGTLGGAAKEATFSPAFTFNLGKQLQAAKYGNTSMDCQAGLMIPVALDLLRDKGAVPWARFPYDASRCDRLPTAEENSLAGRARIGGWSTLESRDAVRQALAQSRPVVFSMSLGQPFFTWSGKQTYTYTTSSPTDGLHAMTIVGYDDEKSAFRVINSWGADWGDQGYFWLGYDSFDALARWQGRLQAFAVVPVAGAASPIKPVIEEASPELALTAIRNSLTCGDLVWRKQGAGYVVNGYVGSAAELAAITAAVQKAAPGASLSLEVLPWPQCEVRRRLTSFQAGIPLSLTANNAVVEPGRNGTADLRQEDFFTLAAGTDAATRYLTVVYIQADGTAVPLYDAAPPAGAAGTRQIELGTGAAMYRVSAPFGPEAVVAVASDGPVFRNLPASGVAERQFLDMLNRHLMEATQKGRPIRVASLLLTTRPR